MLSSEEVRVVRIQANRRATVDPLHHARIEGRLQCARHAQRDLGLDFEDVLQLPRVRLGPKMAIGRCVDELGRDPQIIPSPANAPFHHVLDVQLLSDRAGVLLRGLEDHRRIP